MPRTAGKINKIKRQCKTGNTHIVLVSDSIAENNLARTVPEMIRRQFDVPWNAMHIGYEAAAPESGLDVAYPLSQAVFDTSAQGADTYTGDNHSFKEAGEAIFNLGATTADNISAVSIANPSSITVTSTTGLVTGDTVTIAGTSTTPSINGQQVITVVDATHFTIPVNVTAVATGTGTWVRDRISYDGPDFVNEGKFLSAVANNTTVATFRLDDDFTAYKRGAQWNTTTGLRGRYIGYYNDSYSLQVYAVIGFTGSDAGTATQIDKTGGATGIHSSPEHDAATPYVEIPDPGSGDRLIALRCSSSGTTETDKYSMMLGAVIWNPNVANGMQLSVIANAGWQTVDHSGTVSPELGVKSYSSTRLAQMKNALTWDAAKQVVIMVMLGFDDSSTGAQYKTNLAAIAAAYRTAFGATAWILYTHPWSDKGFNDDDQRTQWTKIRELVAADSSASFGISIAEATAYRGHTPTHSFSIGSVSVDMTGGSWNGGTKTLTITGQFASAASDDGWWFYCPASGGPAGMSAGWYYIATKTSNNVVVMDSATPVSGVDPTTGLAAGFTVIQKGYLDRQLLHPKNQDAADFFGQKMWYLISAGGGEPKRGRGRSRGARLRRAA